MKIDSKEFGKTKAGESVQLYTFKNDSIELEIINYGGIIKSLKTKDKAGNFQNIVLGYDTLEDYTADQFYYGCITGRVAGRIKDGLLKLNSDVYILEKNNGNNNLHGGINSLNTKVWKSSVEVIGSRAVLTLRYKSPHLENGFPGTVDFTVLYTLEANALTIEYFGKSDKATYMNLTNHSYFNLSGDASKSIKSSCLKVNSSGYGAIDKNSIPVKLERECNFLKFGVFQNLSEILNSDAEQLKLAGGGVDHPFRMSKAEEFDIVFKDIISGRVMKISSTEPVAVIYTGNFLEKQHSGICFEMQDYPDVFNFKSDAAKIYDNLNLYSTKTKILFEIM
ncbi:MAG: aldose epimerase family protein [Fusobacteriaceae bacterium]